ncbi:MAG TPA: hypothetical protein VFF29_07265, partial [Bacteroidota bacterium]|nr:hypothetical protein [Bacteroidota bacterium]
MSIFNILKSGRVQNNSFMMWVICCLLVTSFLGLTSTAFAQSTATVTTDKLDYMPGEHVIVSGSGWAPGETVSLLFEESPYIHPPQTLYTVADGAGNISNSDYLIEDHDLGQTFTLTATGLSSGLVAQTIFTDGNPAGNLDQARNGGVGDTPISPVDWVNGNAGEQNSHYIEGQSIPYRLRLTNLSIGSHYVDIEWDISHSSRNAIDYITHYQRIAETVSPLLGFSGSFSAPSTFAIPTPIPTETILGNPQPQTSFGSLPASERLMTIYNGTITSLTYINNADGNLGDLNAAQSATRMRINFTASNDTVVFAWGGHIGTRLDWGVGNSA